MAVLLVVSALLLDFLGCTMPLSWIADTKGIKAGVFLIWLTLVVVAVLMGLLHRDELAGVNPLLTAGLESICLVSAIYPLFGFATSLAPCGTAQINTVTVLAILDLLVSTAGYVSLLLGTVWLIFF